MTTLLLLGIPFVVALLVVLSAGKPVIRALAARKARQPISGDAPASHQVKQGTPTMGGLLILAATAIATIVGVAIVPGVRASAHLEAILAVLATFLLAGGIGLLDDLGKARKKQNKAGLSERMKLLLQVAVASAFAVFLACTHVAGFTTALTVGSYSFDLGGAYYVLAVLFICFFGNAVNFTDGLDGLSSGVTVIVSLGLGLAAGSQVAGQIGVFYGALAGACAGFLFFNSYPAKVFMGDTGSLALGMGLAAAALVAKQELLLLIVGIVYVAEIASMMIQRYVFKYRRIRFGIEYAKAHRVFRRAPLHHHFEELGWRETKVVARFCAVALIAAVVGILVGRWIVTERPLATAVTEPMADTQ